MLPAIREALDARRYESARRLCIAALQQEKNSPNTYLLWQHLHSAYNALGDYLGATEAWEAMVRLQPGAQFRHALMRASDYHTFSAYGFYRNSEAEKSGITGDEYADQMNALAWQQVEVAAQNIADREQRTELIALLTHYVKEAPTGAALLAELCEQATLEPTPVIVTEEPKGASTATANGTLYGYLTFEDGAPVHDALVTLGLEVDVEEADPATYLDGGMHSVPRIGEQRSLTAKTDAEGNYRLEAVPAGRHEFLAVTLEGATFDIVTRFLHHGIEVAPGEMVALDAVVKDWQSAPSRLVAQPFPEQLEWAGVTLTRVKLETWKNPFYFDFPRQLVRWQLPENACAAAENLVLFSSLHPGSEQPFQLSEGELCFFAELPQLADVVWALYEKSLSQASRPLAPWDSQVSISPNASLGTALIETGRATFEVAWGEGGAEAAPPLIRVKGEDGQWRGQGRFTSGPTKDIARATRRSFELLQPGPLVVRWRTDYEFSSGDKVAYVLEAHAGEAYLLCHEICQPTPGEAPEESPAFEFSLREFGSGGRGFLHWNNEGGSIHWTTLAAQEQELARLQESVPWWIPPCGFGYAMTSDGLENADYVGVFTLRRGDWVDREFDRLCRGPINEDGTENRELDWPFPEMIGSTISMITARTDAAGDAYFRFGAFDGERHWGLLVSTLERNDGPHKEISQVQHKNSSPTIQDFKDWHLDEPDAKARPHVVASRDRLKELRARRTNPTFAAAWEKIRSGKVPGPTLGLAFAVEGDPMVGWRKKRELVGLAHIRAKMTLLGRDYSDMYSPVGARPITQWAEDYDLIAASGVFTEAEERLVRGFLVLMGYLYLSPDLMNWKFGSRNANFEADRTDVVAAIGLCFHGQPGMDALVEHTVELMESSLNVYCTPGSGKWYENPACYYLQASKCRTNLCYHLWNHGIYDSSQLPRFKEFLRWGILLLTPMLPRDNNFLRDGGTSQQYEEENMSRRIPPIGDHADLGRFMPEHYAVMSRLYEESDPAFADELMWAYQQGGSDGLGFANLPLFFAAMQEDELYPRAAPELVSRRLEGFGAVLRDNVGQPDEFYLLSKQGPGGYRYHRTEGSFVLFADGKPLVYDGGEAGETWRHSTLSFFDVHTPLAPGRVVSFAALPGLGYNRGIHPKAIRPGEPPFLSDRCDHQLVQVAWDRFAEPNPEVERSFLAVGTRYVLVLDALDLDPEIPHHWHLQVVGHLPDPLPLGEDPLQLTFAGRYGTDLQLVLHSGGPVAATLSQLPILEYAHHRDKDGSFETCHLQVTPNVHAGQSQRRHTALLCPLVPGGMGPLRTELMDAPAGLTVMQVLGEDVHDILLHGNTEMAYEAGGIKFFGRAGLIKRHEGGTQLVLLESGTLEFEGLYVQSDGPAVLVCRQQSSLQVHTSGTGQIKVGPELAPHVFQASAAQSYFEVPLL